MSNILSYKYLLDTINHFKKSGSKYDDTSFNIYDTPSQKYFKILFHFGSHNYFASEKEQNGYGGGLLAPTWLEPELKETGRFYEYNSAWAYLKNNAENTRAAYLKRFINLLSDINIYSPWYFSSIVGLQEAINRKFAETGKMDMSEDQKISITCLPDAFDNRISTLLELYRAASWSWLHKREVIPANLRKFDMTIIIFEAPTMWWHSNDNIIGKALDVNSVSFNAIHLQDCEFNYNSIKTGFSVIDNQKGINPTYTIDISYADCYTQTYNDISLNSITDLLWDDILSYRFSYSSNANAGYGVSSNSATEALYGVTCEEIEKYINELDTDDIDKEQRLNRYARAEDNHQTLLKIQTGERSESKRVESHNKLILLENILKQKTYINFPGADKATVNKDRKNINYDKTVVKDTYNRGFLSNVVDQVGGHFIADISSKVKKLATGNINGFSLTKMANDAKTLLSGDVVGAAMIAKDYITTGSDRIKTVKNKINNLNEYDIPVYGDVKLGMDHFNNEYNATRGNSNSTLQDSDSNTISIGNLFNSDSGINESKNIGNIFTDGEVKIQQNEKLNAVAAKIDNSNNIFSNVTKSAVIKNKLPNNISNISIANKL